MRKHRRERITFAKIGRTGPRAVWHIAVMEVDTEMASSRSLLATSA